MKKAVLEVCCYNLSCALLAQQLGADRIELCSGAQEGGLTPSWGTLQLARQQLTLDVHPIIRPRGGDFCYNDHEFAVIKRDLQGIKSLGFPGVVIGLLTADGEVDMPRMTQLMAEAEGMSVTFHRAFDMLKSPDKALQQLTDLGIKRILTSGQQPRAEQGIALLMRLQANSQGPTIMAGSGVRLDNILTFLTSGVTELHTSASGMANSVMRYRQSQVTMNGQQECDEFCYPVVDASSLRGMVEKMAVWNHQCD